MIKWIFILFIGAMSPMRGQDKLPATIEGDWILSKLLVPDKIYFDAEKDSIWLGKPMLITMGLNDHASPGQVTQMTNQLKSSLKSKLLTLRSDGTYTAVVDILPEPGTFLYDAATRELTLKPADENAVGTTLKITDNDELEQLQNVGQVKQPLIRYRRKK